MMAMIVEQLSFFTPVCPVVAVCCMDGQQEDAEPVESWMKRLVPGGEYFVRLAGHPMVLKPAPGSADSVPKGHEYYHFTIGRKLYSGVFVGREKHEAQGDF